jgi:small-conductance mechanosensitive channel
MAQFHEWLNLPLFTVSGHTVTVATVITLVMVVVITFLVSRAVQRILTATLRRGGLEDEGTLRTITRLTHYAVLLVGFAVGLQVVGISLTTVFAAGAVVAVGVGFALQNILQNFVSGVILLAERSITEEDVLEVEGRVILVRKLGARATVAVTRDGHELIIPNSILVQSTVTNYTLTDAAYRVKATVGVAYDSDMDQVDATLHRAARAVPNRLDSRDPVVFMTEFGDSSVVWTVYVWAEKPWDAPVTASDLNRSIWRALKEDGITISFPQLDVHFDRQPPSGGRGLTAIS